MKMTNGFFFFNLKSVQYSSKPDMEIAASHNALWHEVLFVLAELDCWFQTLNVICQ